MQMTDSILSDTQNVILQTVLQSLDRYEKNQQ